MTVQLQQKETAHAAAEPRSLARRPARRRRAYLWLLLALVCVPSLLPVLFVLVSSVTDSSPGQSPNWSLEPWVRAFSSPTTVHSLLSSLLLTIRVPISIAIAFALAWFLVRVDIPGRKLVIYALWFGFFLPVLPMTFGWMLLVNGRSGLLNQVLIRSGMASGPVFNLESIPGILWVHLTLTTVPIITILLIPALRALDASFEEASDIAGARTTTTMLRVSLPLVAPAILAAALAGFVRSLETFEVEQVLGIPADIYVYSTRIYNLLRSAPPDYPQAMALSTLLLAVLFVVALVYQRVIGRYAGNSTITGRGVRVRERPRTPMAWVIAAFLYLSIFVVLVVPFGMLVAGSFTKLFGFFFLKHPWTTKHWVEVLTSSTFLPALRNSLMVSLVVGLAGVLLFSLLGTFFARSRSRLAGTIALGAWLPWAVPGLLMGTAYLTVFLITPGLSAVLNTLLPLIIVLLVQGMPLGSMMMRSAVNQVSRDLEEASYVAGAGWLRTYFRVTLPLVAPMAVSVFVVAFMSAMRDVSATVLLTVPGTRTLSLQMFQYATSSEPEAAAVLGVLIAVVALAMTAVVLRLGARFSVE
jgi:iron(III) transport system permease protein